MPSGSIAGGDSSGLPEVSHFQPRTPAAQDAGHPLAQEPSRLATVALEGAPVEMLPRAIGTSFAVVEETQSRPPPQLRVPTTSKLYTWWDPKYATVARPTDIERMGFGQLPPYPLGEKAWSELPWRS